MKFSKDDPFDFNEFEELSKPVRYKGAEYVLWEANAQGAAAYNNGRARRIFLKDGKASGVGDIGDLEVLLVSRCLVYKGGKNDGKLVPLNELNGWPERIIKPMHDWVKEVSDLDEDDTVARALQKALRRPDSPVRFGAFQEWAKSLEDTEFDPLKGLLEPLSEDKAKNGQEASTDFSESERPSASLNQLSNGLPD